MWVTQMHVHVCSCKVALQHVVSLLWYYLIHHTFCEIEYMLYIDERIAKKLLLPPSMAQEPWKSSASVWSVRCLTQSMMLGGKTYIVTFTTRGWEAWLTVEPWSAMLYSICIHYSRHESYGHADGITHDDHGSSNRCTFWAFSGPTREWPDQIWILLDQCLGDSISGYATQEFVSDWAFQVCFMMLKYCEDSA